MLLSTLDQITATYLEDLCESGAPESATLDFKRELPGPKDEDRRELLKDVSAMANSEGGDLVFGIEEANGAASAIVPISAISADEAMRRIVQVVEGLEPRVQGIQFRSVAVGAGYVLLLRIPASFDGPHSVRINDNRRFVMRNGPKTSDMTYEQLRSAFDRTATLVERARSLALARTQAVIDMRAKRLLPNGALCVFNAIPLAGLAGKHSVNIVELNRSGNWTKFMTDSWGGGASKAVNLDGFLVYPGGDRGSVQEGYTQVYRDGGLESVLQVGRRNAGQDGNRAIVFSRSLAEFCRRCVMVFLESAKTWGFSGPALLNFALLNVEGYELGLSSEMWSQFNRAFTDRPHLVLPEVFVPNIEVADLDEVAKPQLDMFWQAFDVDNCTEYDAQGNWKKARY